MTFTIQPRSAWGQYVPFNSDLYQVANDPPRPSLNLNWSPVMGVFIHHRGPGSADLPDEAACRKDIADVFLGHARGPEYFGDIAYNWMICPHGNVYTGRGYERGEANYGRGPTIEGYGRNEAFYSICA